MYTKSYDSTITKYDVSRNQKPKHGRMDSTSDLHLQDLLSGVSKVPTMQPMKEDKKKLRKN